MGTLNDFERLSGGKSIIKFALTFFKEKKIDLIWCDAREIAIPFYKKANDFNPDNAFLNYKLGDCNLVSIHKYHALDYFLKAYKLKPTIAKDIHYKIGRAYQYQYKFDEALHEYGLFRKTLNNDADAVAIVELSRFIKQCETGKKLMDLFVFCLLQREKLLQRM